MNIGKYHEQLVEIASGLAKKLQALQKDLTMKENQEVQPLINAFWLTLLQESVGKDVILYYLIDLLNAASKQQWTENNMNAKTLKRFLDIKKEQEEIGKT
jgi:hypothetical protein